MRQMAEFPKELAKALIRVYQKTLSLDHGLLKKYPDYRFCRFTPSCSEYTYQAIDKYGIFKGSALGVWRILRCNPWNPGGKDPVK